MRIRIALLRAKSAIFRAMYLFRDRRWFLTDLLIKFRDELILRKHWAEIKVSRSNFRVNIIARLIMRKNFMITCNHLAYIYITNIFGLKILIFSLRYFAIIRVSRLYRMRYYTTDRSQIRETGKSFFVLLCILSFIVFNSQSLARDSRTYIYHIPEKLLR